MKDVVHKMAFDAIGMSANILETQEEYLNKFIKSAEGVHSYLHITDPTLYMKVINDEGFDVQVELAKAAITYLNVVKRVKRDLMGEVADDQ